MTDEMFYTPTGERRRKKEQRQRSQADKSLRRALQDRDAQTDAEARQREYDTQLAQLFGQYTDGASKRISKSGVRQRGMSDAQAAKRARQELGNGPSANDGPSTAAIYMDPQNLNQIRRPGRPLGEGRLVDPYNPTGFQSTGMDGQPGYRLRTEAERQARISESPLTVRPRLISSKRETGEVINSRDGDFNAEESRMYADRARREGFGSSDPAPGAPESGSSRVSPQALPSQSININTLKQWGDDPMMPPKPKAAPVSTPPAASPPAAPTTVPKTVTPDLTKTSSPAAPSMAIVPLSNQPEYVAKGRAFSGEKKPPLVAPRGALNAGRSDLPVSPAVTSPTRTLAGVAQRAGSTPVSPAAPEPPPTGSPSPTPLPAATPTPTRPRVTKPWTGETKSGSYFSGMKPNASGRTYRPAGWTQDMENQSASLGRQGDMLMAAGKVLPRLRQLGMHMYGKQARAVTNPDTWKKRTA